MQFSLLEGLWLFSIESISRELRSSSSECCLQLLSAHTGRKDYFRVISVFDRIVDTGMFNIPKRRFVKTLLDNGISEGIDKIYRRLSTLERINQKLIFNQLYNSDAGFLKEEVEFLRQFSSIEATMSYKKQILKYVKESESVKITDYL